jgi:hypothetical protein
MATQRQIEAFRANAQKSTGPRTPEGKRRSAQNSRKHRELAAKVLEPGEDVLHFRSFANRYYAEFVPVGPRESQLVDGLAGTCWRLARLMDRVELLLADVESICGALDQAQSERIAVRA